MKRKDSSIVHGVRRPWALVSGLRVGLLLLAVALLVGGCAPPKEPRVFWPAPPEEPRAEFLGVYYSQLDFPKTGWQRLLETIIGEESPAGFKSPYGIAVDSRGRVFVSDLHAQNIRIFDFDARTVEYFTEDPIFGQPRGVAIDGDDLLYVADSQHARVTVYDPQRKPIRTIGNPTVLPKPNYVVVNDRLGRVYVSDARLHKVVVFDKQGKYLFSFGELGQENGQFSFPQGLAINDQNQVYVADYFNARIQGFDADGKFLLAFGERGDLASQFEQPRALAFDSDGNLWIADNRRGSIYTYKPDGTLLMVTGVEGRTAHPLGFTNPFGMVIDRNDRIYVTDMLNKRFSMWQYLSKKFLAAHPIPPEDLEATGRLIIRPDEAQ